MPELSTIICCKQIWPLEKRCEKISTFTDKTVLKNIDCHIISYISIVLQVKGRTKTTIMAEQIRHGCGWSQSGTVRVEGPAGGRKCPARALDAQKRGPGRWVSLIYFQNLFFYGKLCSYFLDSRRYNEVLALIHAEYIRERDEKVRIFVLERAVKMIQRAVRRMIKKKKQRKKKAKKGKK